MFSLLFRVAIFLFYSSLSFAYVYKCHMPNSQVYVYANEAEKGKHCIPISNHVTKISASLMRQEEASNSLIKKDLAQVDLLHGHLSGDLPAYGVGSQISPALQKKFDSKREEILKRELYQESVSLLEVIKKLEAFFHQSVRDQDKNAGQYHKLIKEKEEHEENIHALRQEIAHVETYIKRNAR